MLGLGTLPAHAQEIMLNHRSVLAVVIGASGFLLLNLDGFWQSPVVRLQSSISYITGQEQGPYCYQTL